ncbi:hypothetical protein TSOC_015167, partial [Tetrabaena socialis]
DCILYGGNYVGRSRFEALAGSKVARWYRSIKVAGSDLALGDWLLAGGVPVYKNRSRPKTTGAAALPFAIQKADTKVVEALLRSEADVAAKSN